MTKLMRKTGLLITCFLIVCYFAVFLIINFKYLPHFTDGDIYADMLLSKLIWQQKKLFPSNWIYGNQYYVIATPVLAALWFGITGSMNTAMAAATTTMGLLLIISFLWMIFSVSNDTLHSLLCLLIFLAAPAGKNLVLLPQGQLFFTLASYYSCYLITVFVVFGCYIRCWNPSQLRIPFLSWGISLLLSFACGMQSLRQTAIMIIPLCGIDIMAGFLIYLRSNKQAGIAHLRPHLFVILCSVSNILGHYVMHSLQVPSKTIYGTVTIDHTTLFVERLRSLWHAFRGISGIDASQNGLFFIALMLFFFILVLAAIFFLVQSQRYDTPGFLLWFLFVSSILGTGIASLIFSISIRQIYLFLWYPLLSVSALILFENKKAKKSSLLAVITVCLFSLLNLHFSYGSSFSYAREKDVSSMQQFCADAEEAGYQIVYGGWDVTPQFLVWSDGALTGGFWEEPTFYIRDHINQTDIYTEKSNENALYLFSEWDLAPNADVIESEMEYFGRYQTYTAFTSTHQLMRWPEWLSFMNEKR